FYNIKIVTDDFKKWFSKPMPFEIGTKEKFNQELVRTLENLAADKKRWPKVDSEDKEDSQVVPFTLRWLLR
ncbi:MAG: hypothetical protein GY941_19000, partial [Planctomycetes bacterium]|nr:hypothetical protein [Planctomycetota bacterium]